MSALSSQRFLASLLLLAIICSLCIYIEYLDISVSNQTEKEKIKTTMSLNVEEYDRLKRLDVDDKRLCEQNPYTPSLNKSLYEISTKADNWIANQSEIEKDIVYRNRENAWNHIRFDAFEEFSTCNTTCVGGACRSDRSKIMCGLSALDNNDDCVVYSVGSNNYWEFENAILSKTSCTVHTFDCTGLRTRFKEPQHERLHFHYICLGAKPVPAPLNTSAVTGVLGEIMTLHQIQKMLNHTRIDLLKFDIEGYEWPILESWPLLSDPSSKDYVLPYQIIFELHYKTQMKDLVVDRGYDFKHDTDVVNLASRLIKLGYATIVRDNNRRCKHCTELTTVRFRCPESRIS